MVRSALVKAVGNATQGPAIAGFIASWSVDLQTGVAIVVMRNDDSSFSRVVARFVPIVAECTDVKMSECIDGEITSISGDAEIIQGDSIHFETDKDTKVIVTFGSDEYDLEIRMLKEVQKPYIPQDSNATLVVLREGQREGPLLVQKIFSDRIEGLNYPEYPIAMDQGLPITLRVGEKASNGCTVFLTLAKIEDGSATFLRKVDESRPCPICWVQLQLMSAP